uniref:Candidate secreted effector n=1 Tax=Meloidogyne incognita TaxID=6306 RepID=A0A914L5V7_MELIC
MGLTIPGSIGEQKTKRKGLEGRKEASYSCWVGKKPVTKKQNPIFQSRSRSGIGSGISIPNPDPDFGQSRSRVGIRDRDHHS